MIRNAAFAATLVFATGVHAQPAEAPYCEIAIQFTLDGREIASPVMFVSYGEPADVTVGDPAGHAWHFYMLADAPAIVHRASVIPVRVEIYEVAKGEEYARLGPRLKLVPGQRADVNSVFGDGDGRKAHLSIVASPRTKTEIEAMRSESDDPSP